MDIGLFLNRLEKKIPRCLSNHHGIFVLLPNPGMIYDCYSVPIFVPVTFFFFFLHFTAAMMPFAAAIRNSNWL